MKEHQNPIYNPNQLNYVYVRITNNSCVTSTGEEELKLYWTKANTSAQWPLHWEGNLYMTDPVTFQQVQMGKIVTIVDIPILQPGQETILEIPWDNIPNPNDFFNINPNPWHFCLLARIDTASDPMTFPETTNIPENVLNNNNIAWKNLSIINIIPDTPLPIGGVVSVGNHNNQQKTFDLEFKNDLVQIGKPIYSESEVTIEMDSTLYRAWLRGGSLGHNI